MLRHGDYTQWRWLDSGYDVYYPILNMSEILINPSEDREILDFRKWGFRDVLVLGRYRYAAAHQPLLQHSHGNLLEICYLQKGQQTYRVDRRRYELTGGDVFLTFPHERHGTGGDPESKGVLFWLILRLPKKKQSFLSLSPSESRRLTRRLLALPRHFRLGDQPAESLNRVFTVYAQPLNSLRAMEWRNLLLRFLLDLLGTCTQIEPHLSAPILKAREIIDNHLDRVFSLRQLARFAALSESRFKERFRSEVGIPPAEYAARKKIERAKSLLRAGNHSITEIAMNLGFSSSQYFATVFKRYTGCNPSQFRSQCR